MAPFNLTLVNTLVLTSFVLNAGERLRELHLFYYQSWQIGEFFTRKTYLDLENYCIKFN